MTNDLMVYLKTTDTCQLNCDHCFTNGVNGKKGWFDVEKTIDFFTRLKEFHPENYDSAIISFHGGEPLLCPPDMMLEAWEAINGLWDNIHWSVQTNLTFPLTDAKIEILEKVCEKSWGTSWDKDIRWPDINKELLWESNVKRMAAEGHQITVMVSVNKAAVQMEPIDIINKMAALGVQHINFERITLNGNATRNPEIMPENIELDEWFDRMYAQCVEHKTYKYIDNMFFDSILTQLVHSTHAGCRCRECEQKILTINADGTVGGCPNGAVESQFGHINDEIPDLWYSEGRMCNIQSEVVRHPMCYSCPVFDLCNGDCHQLGWQGPVCAAPKTLMTKLKKEQDVETYKLFLNGFVGQE
jgi:radical SAM protein with 4Fe4S-binding SPASM domain